MNWYQPEHSIGLHSDDEPEMDLSLPILSLSWGGPRRFLLRPKGTTITTTTRNRNPISSSSSLSSSTLSSLSLPSFGSGNGSSNGGNGGASVHEVLLQAGDLLIMGGKCQEEFKHEIPKVRKKDGLVTERISWTIRSVDFNKRHSLPPSLPPPPPTTTTFSSESSKNIAAVIAASSSNCHEDPGMKRKRGDRDQDPLQSSHNCQISLASTTNEKEGINSVTAKKSRI
jgi:hypothetical protein